MPWRERRLEFAPATGIEFGSNDNPAWLWGGEVAFYPLDRLGVGLWGAGASPIIEQREHVLCAVVGPELVLVPLSRKAAFARSIYFPYDLHLEAAVVRVAVRQVSLTEARWAPTLGVGLTAFSASAFSTAIDYRLLLGDVARHTLLLSFGFWPVKRHWDDE